MSLAAGMAATAAAAVFTTAAAAMFAAAAVFRGRTLLHLVERLLLGLFFLAKKEHYGHGEHHHHVQAEQCRHHFLGLSVSTTGIDRGGSFGFFVLRVSHWLLLELKRKQQPMKGIATRMP
jgi:hypothetical protein